MALKKIKGFHITKKSVYSPIQTLGMLYRDIKTS